MPSCRVFHAKSGVTQFANKAAISFDNTALNDISTMQSPTALGLGFNWARYINHVMHRSYVCEYAKALHVVTTTKPTRKASAAAQAILPKKLKLCLRGYPVGALRTTEAFLPAVHEVFPPSKVGSKSTLTHHT